LTTEAKSISQPILTTHENTPPQAESQESVFLPWLTLETALYMVILVIGVGLRLWNLGTYPLSNSEAVQSLPAYQLYGGGQPEANMLYSPLLVSLNTLVFLLIHDSTASARLITVLAGSALFLLPATLRRQLGTLTCLLASILLAISPTALFLSRTLNSEIFVALGALMIIAGFFNWTDNGRRHWLYLLAGGLAVLLTAGPMAYSILLILAVIVLFKWGQFKELWANGLNLDAEDDAQPKGLPTGLKRAGIFLLVAVILLSTAATLNLSGFSIATGLPVDWLSRFGFTTTPESGYNAVFLLTVYEPLLVLAGLVGLAYALLTRNLLQQIFVGWFVGVLILDLMMGGRPAGSVILAVVPLAFLAAFALSDLFDNLQERGSWGNEGIILAAGLVISSFGYIGLTGWLTRTCGSDDTFCQLAWLQSVAALALFAVIVAFFWFLNGAGTAIRGAALTGVAVGLIATLSIGWRLNYGPLVHLAYQPLARIPASTELVALTQTLRRESVVRVDDDTLLDVAVAGGSPTLQWQLRNFKYLTQTDSLSGVPASSAIITAPPADKEQGLDLGEAYLGQDFDLDAAWSPVGLSPKDLLNWLIYRQAGTRPEGQKVVLWLRLEQGQ